MSISLEGYVKEEYIQYCLVLQNRRQASYLFFKRNQKYKLVLVQRVTNIYGQLMDIPLDKGVSALGKTRQDIFIGPSAK